MDLHIETFILREAPKFQFIFLLFFLVCWANQIWLIATQKKTNKPWEAQPSN
jgi:hypothetical protein